MKNISKRVTILLIVSAMLLSGCAQQAQTKTDTVSTATKLSESFPLNTQSDVERWGNEANFFRLADFTSGAANIDDFKSGLVEVESGHYYSAVVYCHNTSDQSQETRIEFSHPFILRCTDDSDDSDESSKANSPVTAQARIVCGGSELVSHLVLKPDPSLDPRSILNLRSSQDEIAIHDQDSHGAVDFHSMAVEYGNSSRLLTVEVEIPAGATYVAFFGLSVLPTPIAPAPYNT